MFERSMSETLRTVGVGIGLSVVVIGTALAAAFW
jgi:hypothetical protein